MTTTCDQRVRVFVSYSDDSRKHMARVQMLAADLDEAGFSVFLDQWIDAPPGHWSLLVERELRRADVVLCVCTPTYCERVDDAPPVRGGPGATREAALVRKLSRNSIPRAERCVVVHFEGTTAVPAALDADDVRRFGWPSQHDELCQALMAPTLRRRLAEACALALGVDPRSWAAWAAEWTGLELEPELEPGDRARHVADGILLLDEPTARARALAALAGRLSEDERAPIDAIAEELGLGELPWLASSAPSSIVQGDLVLATPGPVVLVALANDHSKDGTHLPSLAEEGRGIEGALDGVVELVLRHYATLEDVWNFFCRPSLQGRIQVFHFGGHACENALDFTTRTGTSASAGSEGMADFLGRQPGLVLVFLNGCCTYEHIELLRGRGVRAVIGTREPILDAAASELATRFYLHLRHEPLERAFLHAVAYMKSTYHDPRKVLRDVVKVAGSHSPPRWPWVLECDVDCKTWRLGEPAPPLPEGPVPHDELELYRTKIVSLHLEVRIIGFETTVQTTLRLDELYVPLDARADRGRHEREPTASERPADGPMPASRPSRDGDMLADAFRRAGRLGKRGVIVLGGPGSGKTTHLKQVLLDLVQDNPRSVALGLPEGTIPVFLPLRELPSDHSDGLDGFIERQLEDPMLGMQSGFGRRLRKRGKLLFLLDGLDEVPGASERAEVARWIEQALHDAPDCYFLVSCRNAGYTKEVALHAEFLELHLQPLDDQQMRQFVTNWYRLVERAVLRDPKQAEIEAARRAGDLLDTLSQTDFTAVARVYEMTRNPLLLTAICLVHRERGRLPHARAQLYEESIKVLLERWHGRPLQVDHAVRVFQPVAHWMHSQVGRTRAPLADLERPVHLGLAMLRHVSVSAAQFLQSIRNDSGLMMASSTEEYGFMHLGFQEFLAARWVRNVAHRQPQELLALAQRFDESWWREVILLLLALDDPCVFDELMRAVVQQPEFPSWADSEVMALALQEAAEVSAAPFVEVLMSPNDGSDGQRARQLAALRILARAMPDEVESLSAVLCEHPTAAIVDWWREHERRHGRGGEVIVSPRGGIELVRIPGGRFTMGEGSDAHEVELASFYLTRTPVTNAQYEAYLKENPGVRKPNRWGDRKYNQPDQPVVGVSWHDAVGYCEWAGLALPTEAQWEYACRAGTTTRYYSGDREKDLAKVGWYDGNSGERAHPVGEKEPNVLGLYDMHGNVWEWCLDENGPYDTAPRLGDGLRHPPLDGDHRILRGGSWDNGPDFARSATREWDTAGGRWVNVGFRPRLGGEP